MDLAVHLHRVVEVTVLGEHRLRVAFDDGVVGEIDASAWTWRGVFAPLRDPDYFAQVELDQQLGTISWPNGADIAPETLHLWVAEQREHRPPEQSSGPGSRANESRVTAAPALRDEEQWARQALSARSCACPWVAR